MATSSSSSASSASLLCFPASSSSSAVPFPALTAASTSMVHLSATTAFPASVVPLPVMTAASPSPSAVPYSPSAVPHSPLSTPPLLYSPSAGTSPSSLQIPAQEDVGSVLRELRSNMVYCMDRFHSQELHIISLTKNYGDLVSWLNTIVTQQNAEIQALRTNDTNKDILIRTLTEEISQLRSGAREHRQLMDTRFQEVSVPVPVAEIQEKIATIQTEVQRHSEWVEVARKKPPVHHVTVSETIAESDRRAQRSLNLRIRGIERSNTVSPFQQAQEFVTHTMGITDHGIESAHRAGTDLSREQPLIVRFRDAESRLAVLRRRRCLREYPQIHLDEDLTPLQWQEYRALLPQRHTARQEGLWAVIRDGRLITRPLRTTRPVPTPAG